MVNRTSLAIQKSFGLVATLVGFIVDTITLIALINSKVAPSIPFINIPFGVGGQLTIWSIALVTYLGFLREYWLGLSRKLSVRPKDSFWGFFIYDVILGFKHPFTLIPTVILVYFLATITLSDRSGIIFGVIFAIGVLVFAFIGVEKQIENERNNEEKEWKLIYNNENFSRWIDRIKRLLQEKGYVTHSELAELYSEPYSLCIKALRRFCQEFEPRLDLALLTEQIPYKNSEGLTRYYILWVVSPRHLVNQRPWTQYYK